MGNPVKIVLVFFTVIMFWKISVAKEYKRGTPDQALAMVQKVKTKYAKDGLAETIIAINTSSPEFFQGDIYPFIVRIDGTMIAHFFPPLIGQNMLQSQDRKGVYFFQEMVQVIQSKGKGLVSYDFPNPVTGKWDLKVVYVEALDKDHFVAVGVYLETKGI